MRSTGFALALGLALLGAAPPAHADIATDCAAWRKANGAGTAQPIVCLAEKDPNPPAFDRIGATQRELYLGDKDIQNFFNQGLRFLYAFNFRESYRAFRYATELSTSRGKPCGYCHWGIAASLSVNMGQFLTAEPDRQAARAALNKALVFVKPEQKQQWGLINALLTRTEDCKPIDRCAEKRATDYYNYVVPLQSTNVYDAEIAALYADAAFGIPRADRLETARKALKVAMTAPFNENHTGLWHWYLHLAEESGTAKDAVADADKLRAMAPAAAHLVHMAAHVYLALGLLDKAMTADSDAIAAYEKYFTDTSALDRPDGDTYRYESYPHVLQFQIAEALRGGHRDTVEIAAKRLLAAPPKNAGGYRRDFYRAMYYLGRLPLATDKDIREFQKPEAQQPLASVAYYYAQTRADFWSGKTESANLKLLDAAVDAYPDKKKCPDQYQNFHAEPCLVAIMSHLAHAQASAAAKNWKDALTKAQTAAEIRRRIGDGLPGVWYLPVEQTLAALYLRAALGEAQPPQDYLTKAQALLKTSLAASPGNGWTYFGLWQVAKYIRNGNPSEAERVFRAHWAGAAPALDRL